MASIIDMPKLSDTMVTGRIISWLKQEGDEVEAGTAIAEVETDKATMELEVFDEGTLLKIIAQQDSAVPVGGPIAILGKKGEDISSLEKKAEELSKKAAGAGEEKEGEPTEESVPRNTQEQAEEELAVEEKKEKPKKEHQPAAAAVGAPQSRKAAEPQEKQEKQPAQQHTDGGRMRVSPVAQRMAAEHGVDLRQVQGSGPSGRIVKRDIETFVEEGRGQARTPDISVEQPMEGVPYEDISLSSIRATIATRLPQSLGPVPHFYLEVDVDAEPMMKMKNDLQGLAGEELRITLTDILIKACAVALRRNPEINSQFLGNAVRRFNICNIGIAVAGQGTLLVPVIKNCEVKSIGQIARDRAGLVERAQQGKLSSEQMSNGTFTISNLGMMGITRFKAIINPPQSAILAVGTIRDEAVVKNGVVVPGKRMSLSLSCDHRAFDGAEAARFMSDLRQILESPLNIAL